jgi:hypothetical protein
MRSVQALLPPSPEALEDLLEPFDEKGGDSASSVARTSNKRRRELLRQLVSDAADVDGEFSLSFDLRKASGLWSRALDRCATRPTAHTPSIKSQCDGFALMCQSQRPISCCGFFVCSPAPGALAEVKSALLLAQHTRPCPGCGVLIQRQFGCNHMSCTVCRTAFCWVSPV